MIVANGFIRRDKINEKAVVEGKSGRYMDVLLETKKTQQGKWIIEIHQLAGRKLGIAHVGFQNEMLSEKITGRCEINLSRIEWDKGIWEEGHIVVAIRDRVNQHGNSIIIHTDESHKSIERITLGSGKRDDFVNQIPKQH